jgi:lipopolysaccharide transport system ATP-binding protein
MSQTVIAVENLGKKYVLRHQQNENYSNLRDVLTHGLKAPARWMKTKKAEAPMPSKEEFWALRDISFEIKQGEVVGIIGGNGAGKSTLLKILSRITEPATGRVHLKGRVASLLEVGTGFHPELTGRENIFLNGAILGMGRAEITRKFDEIVAFAGVEKFLDTPVKRYSSGMYVRLAFAVAAHLESEILIVDEVLAVGDASFQKKCFGKMGDISKKQGRTILLVSHNMAAVTQLCSRGILLVQGRKELDGFAHDVVQTYLSSQSDQTSSRVWSYPGDAPGDDLVRLLGARVIQEDIIASVVDINQSFQIELEFAALKNVQNLIGGVNFYDIQGNCLFCSADWRPNSLTPGKYIKRINVPAQVLAEGRISILIQLVFYDPDIRSVVLPDALVFDTMESEHPDAVRGLYKGPWPGALRVKLPWSDFIKI